MRSIEMIEKALNLEIFSNDLIYLPSQGASEQQIEETQNQIGRWLSLEHKEILCKWNGGNFDVFRLNSTEEILNYIEWDEFPIVNNKPSICFASTPIGYMYVEDSTGAIWVFDTDGGNNEKIALSMADFFKNSVFGAGANIFGGDDWAEKVKYFTWDNT